MSLPRAYFDMAADGKPLGNIEVELRNVVVPKTCENFRAGFGYKGSTFFRTIPKLVHGTRGKSIYGNKFEDEYFVVKHTAVKILKSKL